MFRKSAMETRYRIQSLEEYTANHEKKIVRVARQATRQPKCAKAYDPTQETPPDYPWFKLNKSAIDQHIRDISDKVINKLQSARPDDKELSSIMKAVSEVREVSASDGQEVAIVGQQGMGKSLLINALQNRRNLSKTTARGKACTASAIKYRHKPGASDLEENYDAAVTFMDDECLDEVIREHIRHYDHFYFSGDAKSDHSDDEAHAAATAKEFFDAVFNTKVDSIAETELRRLLVASNIRNGALFTETLKMAHKRIEETGAGVDRKIFYSDMKIGPLVEDIKSYVSQQDDVPSLWTIVQDVSIYLGSALSREGICVVDLPGKLQLQISYV